MHGQAANDNDNGNPGDGGGVMIPGDEDLLAAELVLGLLDTTAHVAARARAEADPEFAGRVRDWEARFAPWLLQIEAVAPGAQAWLRLRTRLGWSPVDGARPKRLWDNVGLWRAATGLASAATLAALLVGRQIAPEPAPSPVAVQPPVPTQPATTTEAAARNVMVLARDDGSVGWLASFDAAHDKVLMVPVPRGAESDGRVNELWLIPAGQAPISLGFVSNEKAHSVAIPEPVQRLLAVGGTLAITLEPQAGIPHAAPSGPVVAKGGIQQI